MTKPGSCGCKPPLKTPEDKDEKNPKQNKKGKGLLAKLLLHRLAHVPVAAGLSEPDGIFTFFLKKKKKKKKWCRRLFPVEDVFLTLLPTGFGKTLIQHHSAKADG